MPEQLKESAVKTERSQVAEKAHSALYKRALSSLRTSKSAWLGIALVTLVLIAAVFAPLLAPHDPYEQELSRSLSPPVWEGGSSQHLLGTDHLGRDVLSRVIYGSRISLMIGISACAIAGTVGTVLGLLSGYFGGLLDDMIMRLADIQLAFPFILLATAVMFVLGSGLRNIILVLGITGWVVYGRVVRGQVLALREKEFIEASQSLGAGTPRTLTRHVFPNVSSSIMVIATVEIARVIISEASLTFLGLGVDPRIPTWGGMLAEGRQYLAGQWWIATFPGLAIMVTVLGLNLLGDWMRDVFDPRSIS